MRDLDGSGATIADDLNGPGIDNKLRQTIGGTPLYFIQDHLGTTRSFTDVSGSVTSSLAYDSFGNVTSGSPSTRYTYTGREGDSDLGLMYYRARWYDPSQGRFVSEDPIGFGGGDINVYAYVVNNPSNLSDPQGLQVRSAERNGPGDKEWAEGLRKQMASWPTQTTCGCDAGDTATLRMAQTVVRNYPGARIGFDPTQRPQIEFPGSFDDVTSNLDRMGYYSGAPWAYNPFHHSGGREFRTYGSPGFHFTIGYPPAGTGYGPYPGVSIWYPTTAPYLARTIDMHIDCRNPVGAGWVDRVLHFFDFLGKVSTGQ